MGEVSWRTYVSTLRSLLELSGRRRTPVDRLTAAFDRERELRPLFEALPESTREARLRGGWMDPECFCRRAQTLVQLDRVDLADRLLEVEAFLYPAHAGISEAVVAVTRPGADPAALQRLADLAADRDRAPAPRLRALWTLREVGQQEAFLRHALRFVEERCGERDFARAAVAAAEILTELNLLTHDAWPGWRSVEPDAFELRRFRREEWPWTA